MDRAPPPTPRSDAPGDLRARLLRRPALFMGSRWEADGLHRLALAIVRLAAAPAGQNAAASVTLALLPDGVVEIADNGRGLPVAPLRPWPDAQRSAPALELARTAILERHPTPAWHALWGFLDAHGAMLAALGAPLVVESGRDGGWWRVACARGAVVELLRPAGSPQARGTRIGFRPDPALFAAHRFDPARLAAGLAAIRAAVPGVDVRLVRG